MGFFSSLFGNKKPAKDPAAAIRDLTANANAGDVASMLELADQYQRGATKTGISLQQSREEAVKWYTKAAGTGSTKAMVALGNLYNPNMVMTVREDAVTAAKWYEKACAAGDGTGAYYAGSLYMGRGKAPKNYARAKHFFEQGMKLGNAASARELGNLYDTGRGGEKNLQKALSCYQQAIAGGDFAAPFHLGDMYYFGRGVEKDIARAEMLYRQAKSKNFADADAMLDHLMLTGAIPLAGKDEDVFYHLVRLSEGFSQNRANFILGMYFENGTFVDQDFAKAIRRYETAAKAGNIAAMRKVSLLEKKDFPGHSADMEKALFWEKKFREELE